MIEDKINNAVGNAEISPANIDERIHMLGIPEGQLSPSVYFALSAMLEKMDDTNRDLQRAWW